MSHEDVINRLENETVSYEVGTGMGGAYNDLFRVSIKVETALYETAISWLKDLLYHAEFDKERLSVVLAKIQQSLPELKRDGNTVLNSLWSNILYSEKSTARSGGVLSLMEFIPQITKSLQEKPDEVIKDFEELRNHFTKPNGLRFSVTGNVLSVDKPRSTWNKYFSLPVGHSLQASSEANISPPSFAARSSLSCPQRCGNTQRHCQADVSQGCRHEPPYHRELVRYAHVQGCSRI